MRKVMMLGSGELGKEVVIALKRMGCTVIACDAYEGAPAMQVADAFEVFSMLDGDALERAVLKHRPDIIVPEVESIRTDKLYEFEKEGIQVTPSAKAANFTMNRKLIRDLAAQELGLKTAPYAYATTMEEFTEAVGEIGLPCVVKPLMSSSGKGQSVVKEISQLETAFHYAMEGSRGDLKEIIVEGFIDFHTEITLLTVTQKSGETLFCAPIGHRQERGDYQESWQPCAMESSQLIEAQSMAKKVTQALGGWGIWGIEFFLGHDAVYFSELSPRPHDTGMVTLAGNQNFNEFELHARSLLGLNIPEIELRYPAVSAVVLAEKEGIPLYGGMELASLEPQSDFKLFGKPTTRPYRRMGVVLTYDRSEKETMDELRARAARIASGITVH
ncbi:formate-dependent phosphoribosylglycinamide formyltransferase [Schleiferiaceae bacterium]|jgi:phosphoribosylglycinamide formyltransferase 2|nr:formate-dependent phosphoribosylglycinamide formyltransferase [Schleiferiaceae bacterium]MDB0057445.1 formate-dependent phosphoribosylglycinamide formyltransferase [Schleiferiaceae bacterium]MDB4177228.1 formate-dependent phosphoribosylglycinamide formyltransferase [Schleiferiaceae bacterium]MDC0082594.1 formate-dependent phosphoribosylglycinamide formyltransferase [Schleiferiaceae bacterium]